MKKNYRDNTSNEILYKTEELLDAASFLCIEFKSAWVTTAS